MVWAFQNLQISIIPAQIEKKASEKHTFAGKWHKQASDGLSLLKEVCYCITEL